MADGNSHDSSHRVDSSQTVKSRVSRRKFLAGTAAGSVGLVAGCSAGGSGTPTTSSGSSNTFTYSTGTSASLAFSMGNAWSSVLRNNSDLTMNVKSSTSSQSVSSLVRGQTDIAYSTTLFGKRAKNREGAFAEIDFQREPLQLPAYYFMRTGLVTTVDSGIEYYGDLTDKSINPGPSGTSFWEVLEIALSVATDDSLPDVRNSGVQQFSSALSSGRVDAVGGPLYTNNLVPSFMQQVYSQNDVRLLGFRPEVVEELESDSRVPIVRVPNGGTLGDIQEYTMEDETVIPSSNYVNYTTNAMSEETIYNLYKTSWDNKQALAEAHAGLRPWTNAEFYIELMTPEIPVHPGAKRFLEEVGAWKSEYTVGEM